MNTDSFSLRHIGPRPSDVQEMLDTIGVSSISQLIDETIPTNIRLDKPLDITHGLSEQEYLEHVNDLASKNKIFKTYIGLGYHASNTPSVRSEEHTSELQSRGHLVCRLLLEKK